MYRVPRQSFVVTDEVSSLERDRSAAPPRLILALYHSRLPPYSTWCTFSKVSCVFTGYDIGVVQVSEPSSMSVHRYVSSAPHQMSICWC